MILTSEEKVRDYGARGWWGDLTLDTLFGRAVEAHPDRIAIADAPNRAAVTDGEPRRLSFAELDAWVDAVADTLLRHGVGRDDIVLVQMPNVVETMVLLLACGRIGVIASPVAVQYRGHELQHIVATLAPRAIATVSRCGEVGLARLAADLLGSVDGPIRLLVWGKDVPEGAVDMAAATSSAEASARVAAYVAEHRPDADDVFTICWTSGTEARPKGVPRSHNQWIAIGRVVASAPHLDDGDILLSPFPMINMASIGGVMLPWLLAAGTIVLHHPFDVAVFLGQIQTERVNYMLAPPPVLNMLLKQPGLLAGVNISSLRAVCSGSAPLAPWMVQGWQDNHGIAVINYFGSNEGIALASGALDVPDATERASYFPRYGVAGFEWSAGAALCFETRLRDPQTGEIINEPGREGEMCIRGGTVFDGYFREPEMTRAAFDADGYFRTGDMFVIVGEGPNPRYYQFVGRFKEIIIRGGQNISLAEVDNIIAGHPAVAEAACVGFADEQLGERLCAIVVPRPGASLTLEDLTAYLTEQGVAIYKHPERLVVADQLPRNPVGKIVRTSLRGLALAPVRP